MNLPGQAHAIIVRSPHAHARIVSVDATAALASPGVLAVFTEADLAADGLGTMRVSLSRKRPDGSPLFYSSHPGLARGRARYVGDPVAMVIAETLSEARDAAELVNIEYDPLPSVTDTAQLLTPGAPAVWDGCPDNLSHIYEAGDRAATEAALAGAAHVVRRRFVISRVYAQFMEPRGAIGSHDPGEDRYTLYADAHTRTACATRSRATSSRCRRARSASLPAMSAAASVPRAGSTPSIGWCCGRRVGSTGRLNGRARAARPSRPMSMRGTTSPRPNLRWMRMAAFSACARTRSAMWAPISAERNLLSTFSNVATLSGVYAIPAACTHVSVAFSNSNPTAPYRGAGRPEAIYVIERMIDEAARELGLDRVALRRKNLVPETAMPYRNAFGVNYDCGAFERGMDAALRLADFAGFAARRDDARRRGRLRGIGIANAIERAASPGLEFAEIRFNPGGSAMVLMGSKNQGQGHETMFKQIVNEKLGIDPAEVQYIDGDTDRVAFGIGTMGSRSTVIGGTALTVAAGKIVAKAKKIAAHLLEAAEADIEFADGQFSVAGTDRTLTLRQVAMAAFQPARLPPGLEPGCTRREPSRRNRTPSRTAAISARWRSIRRPARSRCCATRCRMMSAR